MKKKIFYLLITIFLTAFFFPRVSLSSEEVIIFTLRLNHEQPLIISDKTEYFPVDEDAYIVTDRIIMTNNPLPGHFPDDGIILEKDVRAFWYWADFPHGIKVFIAEKGLLPSHLKAIPLEVRLLSYPEWVRKYYPLVAEELNNDGGWENRLVAFKRDREAYEGRWRGWVEDSERNRRLYEERKEDNPSQSMPMPDNIYEIPSFEIGRKGN